MPNNIIRADYAALETIAGQFEDERIRMARLTERLRFQITRLRRGAWEGDAADEFCRQMDDEIMPACVRLGKAMADGSKATRDIIHLLKEAEAEAARCLSGEAVDNYAVSVYPSVALPVFAKHPVSVEQDGNPLDVVDEGGGGGGGGGFGGLWSTLRNMLTGRVAPSAATTTYTTPNGYTMNIPDGIIPEGYVVGPAENNAGLVFRAQGSSGNANIIRIMEPNSRNPDGYFVYYNSSGQALGLDGKPVSPHHWHLPLSGVGITMQPPSGTVANE